MHVSTRVIMVFNLIIAALLLGITIAESATAHDRWTKADEYEFIDRFDGYNDNCVVSRNWAYCKRPNETRVQEYEDLDFLDGANDNIVRLKQQGRWHEFELSHCRTNPNDCY